ncbi:hypothetical protein D3C78_768110 [compost metagenome]
MKVHCPVSGLSFEVAFPAWGHATYPHPMLSCSAQTLNQDFLELLFAQQLSSELTHLLGLSYLLKLPLVSLTPMPSDAHQTLHTFWLKYMERLARLATTLEGKPAPKRHTQIRVSLDNLSHLGAWIEELEVSWSLRSAPITDAAKKLNSQAWNSVQLSPSRDTERQQEIDALILKGLRGSLLTRKEASKYPETITKWVMNIAPFPTAKIQLPDGRKTTISEHWAHIMELAFSKDGALDLICENINAGDLEELLEHCYENIPVEIGTFATLLWRKLEEVKTNLESYRANGTMPAGQTKAPKIPSFKGTSEELLALLVDDPAEVTSIPAPKTDDSSGLTLQQKLALKLRK